MPQRVLLGLAIVDKLMEDRILEKFLVDIKTGQRR